MCFGPIPSFAASAALAGLGYATFRATNNKRTYLFAFLPLIFAAHQFDEGLLWLALRQDVPQLTINSLALYYLSIALVLFPVYCPTSVYFTEKDNFRRYFLLPFVLWGALVSTYLFIPLLRNEFSATIRESCIYYEVNISHHEVLVVVAYVFATVVPMLLSTERAVKLVGLAAAISCSAAAFWYYENFLSVWCFAAAIISTLIYELLAKPTLEQRRLPITNAPETMK
jgi:hypothetical protein